MITDPKGIQIGKEDIKKYEKIVADGYSSYILINHKPKAISGLFSQTRIRYELKS